MKYQLIIQFSGETEDDFEYLIDIENELEEMITGDSEVDGHDFGSGEMNIFILTGEPTETFRQIKDILAKKNHDFSNLKAAYRNLESENFIILWPNGLAEFIVK
jgi:hypothetical protein